MEHVETDSVWRVIYIYVWRVIYISIVLRQTMVCWRPHFPLLCVKQWHADVSTFICCGQTMACWRQHFPLLCVKQWHADVSTFHCCGQTMVCWCQHFPLCVSPHRDSLRSWSTYGARRNRLCVESDLGKIMFWIRNPDPLSGSSPKFNGMVLG